MTEPHWFQWRNARAAVEIFRGESVEEPILFLRYRNGMMFGIPMESTPQRLGGCRWWFRCNRCSCRVAKVYRIPGEFNWACRTCQGLTYRSAKEAHRLERIRMHARRFHLDS